MADADSINATTIGLGLAIGTGLGVSLGSVIGAIAGDVGTAIVLAMPIGSGIGLTAGIIYPQMQAHRARRDICQACGYSTRELPTTTCPECGADVSKQHQESA